MEKDVEQKIREIDKSGLILVSRVFLARCVILILMYVNKEDYIIGLKNRCRSRELNPSSIFNNKIKEQPYL